MMSYYARQEPSVKSYEARVEAALGELPVSGVYVFPVDPSDAYSGEVVEAVRVIGDQALLERVSAPFTACFDVGGRGWSLVVDVDTDLDDTVLATIATLKRGGDPIVRMTLDENVKHVQ